MKKLVILGSGTAGTMVANKLRDKLPKREWSIAVVDRDDQHHYQPGYLFIPFGHYTRDQVVRSRHHFLADGVDFVIGSVDRVEADDSAVLLEDGRRLDYDQLVIASGTTPPNRAWASTLDATASASSVRPRTIPTPVSSQDVSMPSTSGSAITGTSVGAA